MNQAIAHGFFWRMPPLVLGWMTLLAAILIAVFFDALVNTGESWMLVEEYSHGVLIPFISIFLIWQRRNEIAAEPFTGNWWGVAIVALGLAILVIGELATVYTLQQYALLMVLAGAALAITGHRVFQYLSVPLLLLVFAIPLPGFLLFGLSAKLQLLSSQIGVALIRLFDISVYLEGNVIDLGTYKLQVVEACSGLRYLFPLMSVAFICAYFYQERMWKRVVVFLSSIPLTVLMNSFRVGIIGILVDRWGQSMAEGFLHDFEGWVIFMVCTAILVGEMWLLSRFSEPRRPFAEVFGLTFPEPLPAQAEFRERALPVQFWVVLGLGTLTLLLTLGLQHRSEVIPPRADFTEFPTTLGEWKGSRDTLEQMYIDTLKFDDYLLVNYLAPHSPAAVSLYSAYYSSQRKGASIHSPKTCLPGGGWVIQSSEVIPVTTPIGTVHVNRAVIKQGETTQLVYYWFQQRGRDITDEYAAKWYLLVDALTRNRTDGALVRLTTYVLPREDLSQADRRLQDLLSKAVPELARFIPD